MATKHARTVLLVDDDATVVTLLQHAMTQLGWRVLHASDGVEALTCHEQLGDGIDLLITDLQMPRMRGDELARRLLARCPDLPVIFITADANPQTPVREADFPRHVFVQKPFLPAEVLAHLPRFFA